MVHAGGAIYRAYTALCDRIGHRPPGGLHDAPGTDLYPEDRRGTQRKRSWFFSAAINEGVDERVLEMTLPIIFLRGIMCSPAASCRAMMMIDCISRLVPGVLNNDVSAEFESFHDNLLEYPQYSRPEEFMGRKVPEILLSGHHANIEKWRREQSIIRTLERRPELLEEAVLSKKEKLFLEELLRKKAENQEEDTI